MTMDPKTTPADGVGHDAGNRALMSALADGVLRDEAIAEAVAAAARDGDAQAAWHAYHVIGDVMRSSALADATGDRAFVLKLRERLASEPMVARPEAANDSVFSWKLWATVASVVAAAGVVWNVMSVQGPVASGGQLASVKPPAARVDAAASAPALMLRDARLDELLAAHRQMGGTSALQNPSGFLRNATFEGGSR